MAEKPDHRRSAAALDTAREDRLKAALKANLAKRKAQARGRTRPMSGRTETDEDDERPD